MSPIRQCEAKYTLPKHVAIRSRFVVLVICASVFCYFVPKVFGAEKQLFWDPKESDLRWREVDKSARALEQEAYKSARISYTDVSAPINRFLLIKRADDLCAIRFTAFYRKPAITELVQSPENRMDLFAEYDWYYQSDGSGDLRKQNVLRGRRTVALIGVSPRLYLDVWDEKAIEKLEARFPSKKVNCGPFELVWYYPTGVKFSSSFTSTRDEGIEMAPTRWQRVNDIESRDSGIKWYVYDPSEKRELIRIPISDL